jgi:N-acetyl-1-D-myo-inositol-2-amino-2-deoxy-alpha-D-glucopyranoside deacetylase
VDTRIDRATLLTIALASVFAVAIGVAVGFITTFTHRQYQPWGLVAGLVVIVALVAGFRLVFDSRVIAAAAGIGVVAATALLMLPGAGGSVFVVDDPIGWIWAVAPTLLAVTVVLLPRRRMEP